MKLSFANRDAWLEGRQQGIGASEVAAVLGKCPFHSAYEIFNVKAGLILPDDLSGREEIEWGLRHEATIAQAVAERTGREVALSEAWSMYRADDAPHLLATPDAFQRHRGGGRPGVLQIKTTGFYNREEWEGGCPTHYEIQVQAEMRVTNRDWGSLVVLIGGNRMLGPFDLERNDRFLSAADEVLAEFWDRVMAGIPPAADTHKATLSALSKLYAKESGRVHQLTPEFIPLADELKAVRAAKSAAEKREKELKAMFAAELKDASIGVLPDGRTLHYPTLKRAGYVVEPTTYRTLKLED